MKMFTTRLKLNPTEPGLLETNKSYNTAEEFKKINWEGLTKTVENTSNENYSKVSKKTGKRDPESIPNLFKSFYYYARAREFFIIAVCSLFYTAGIMIALNLKFEDEYNRTSNFALPSFVSEIRDTGIAQAISLIFFVSFGAVVIFGPIVISRIIGRMLDNSLEEYVQLSDVRIEQFKKDNPSLNVEFSRVSSFFEAIRQLGGLRNGDRNNLIRNRLTVKSGDNSSVAFEMGTYIWETGNGLDMIREKPVSYLFVPFSKTITDRLHIWFTITTKTRRSVVHVDDEFDEKFFVQIDGSIHTQERDEDEILQLITDDIHDYLLDGFYDYGVDITLHPSGILFTQPSGFTTAMNTETSNPEELAEMLEIFGEITELFTESIIETDYSIGSGIKKLQQV